MNRPTTKQTTHRWQRWLALWGVCCAALAATAQTSVEYFWDMDPGYGQGTVVSYTAEGETTEVAFDVSTATLTAGVHRLGIRTMNTRDDGTLYYSPTYFKYVVKDVVPERTEIEYFWDEEPGYGKGDRVSYTAGDAMCDAAFDVSTAALANGLHRLGLRTVTMTGGREYCSPTLWSYVLKTKDVYADVVEYFWDEDPGYGKATQVAVTTGDDATTVTFDVSVEGLSEGVHRLCFRSSAGEGWSPTVQYYVRVVSGEPQLITAIEYYWDVDPGFGKGTPIPFTPATMVDLSGYEFDVDGLTGDHHLYIRAQSKGGWSPFVTQLVVCSAEGRFTLNEQLAEGTERNYRSLAEMFGDFALRHATNDITVTVRGGATFGYDATTADALAVLTAVAGDLEKYDARITFEAPSAATLNITANEADMAAVIALCARISLNKVTLNINGTAYDFSQLAYTFEEICSGAATEGVDFSTISEDDALNVAWTAVTHSGIAVTGYPAEGTGPLPSMTLANTTKDKDYVEYSIAVKYGEETACTYTYTIYVYARVNGRGFSGISPTDGKSVDPKEQKLSWKKVTGATEYEISIEKVLTGMIDDATAEVESIAATTTGTSYTLTVESGYTYRWRIKAKGFCSDDLLQSDTYSFSGRLLPDLGVTLTDVPESSKSGAPITISAQVTNNGGGATTESSWTDYLYYSFGSADISTATRLATKSHSGNLNAGDSYTVTFELTAPLAEEGSIHYFVQTDATAKVMEADDTNNTAVTGALVCQPFVMEATCYEQLKLLYNALGGEGWAKQWKISTDHITAENYPGVAFDGEGRVTAISLVGNGLTGTLPEEPIVLPQLTTLNLSRNSLTGDVPATFFTECAALATLNLSYNQLAAVDKALPGTITSLDLSYQHRVYGSSTALRDLTPLGHKSIDLDKTSSDIEKNTLMAYNHNAQKWDAKPNFELRNATLSETYARLSYSGGYYHLSSLNYKQPQDAELVMVQTSGAANGSVQPVVVSYVEADANVDRLVDVLDVQHSLNYVVGEKGAEGLFCWSAANTFADELINIQDIVVTVNHVLDHTNAAAQTRARRMTAAERAKAHGRLYVEDGYLCFTADTAVAALDVELQGASATQVRLMLAAANWQMVSRATDEGVRLVIFSPTGQTLPVGTTRLLALRAEANPIAADAADAKAQALTIAVEGGDATGLDAGELTEALTARIQDGVLHVESTMECEGVTLTLYDPAGRQLVQYAGESLQAGDNMWHIGSDAQGVYLLQVRMANGSTDVMRIAGK